MVIVAALAALLVAAPNVDKLVLPAAQVGPGYQLAQRTDGVGVVNTVTLDLCGRSGYPSEKLRVSRLQVDYVKKGAQIGLSNEVVAYKPGGAALAMREVLAHATGCPARPVDTGQPGFPKLKFVITQLHDAKLLKGAVAVRVQLTGIVQGKPFVAISYAVYQRFGNILSGVYSFGPDSKQQLSMCLQAAERSAQRLRSGAGPKGPIA